MCVCEREFVKGDEHPFPLTKNVWRSRMLLVKQ